MTNIRVFKKTFWVGIYGSINQSNCPRASTDASAHLFRSLREFRLHLTVLGRPESLSLSDNYQTTDEDMYLVKLRTDVRVTLICNENEAIKGIYFYVPNGTFLIF